MMDNLSIFLANWDEWIPKFSPTMVDNLSIFLANWDKWIPKFSPTHGGQIKCIFKCIFKFQNFLMCVRPWRGWKGWKTIMKFMVFVCEKAGFSYVFLQNRLDFIILWVWQPWETFWKIISSTTKWQQFAQRI